ncbi:CCA tRNA nucleotidyltransferase [Elstera sp.]|jgi:poly(A) polymerase/tRNA nucleotidyltransferase (CCA-adding enzyme)|uniref:CCA tRNA nucleotidyltransferase n=1 Tax=Elstera sp. TaxID=1916664 RepID=UPI0037BE5CA8
MTGDISLPPADWWEGGKTQAVLTALQGEARFVGGAVRDALLGLPVQDVDLATPLPPEAVMARAKAAGLKAIPTGIDHGTITLVSGGKPFEVTTLRRDVETDGRHAVVSFTEQWAEDAARRDFTMNALYADGAGRVYDPVGGLPDLAAGRLRFIGDARARIAEDYLRILRYFRFQARYGRVPPGPGLLAILADCAPGLARLSAERIWSEIKKLLACADPLASLEAMHETGILRRILPDARPNAGPILAALPPAPGWAARLLALLPEGAGLPGYAGRLRWSKDELHFIAIAQQMAETKLTHPYSMLRRWGPEPLKAGIFVRAARGKQDRLPWLPLLDAPLPAFPIGGADVQALRVAPGPAMGKLLTDVERWWERGGCQANRAETLAYLAEILPSE